MLLLGLKEFLWLLARPLALLLSAIILATALMPVAERLERWLPRTLAIGLVFLLVLLAFVGIGWVVVLPLVAQAETLVETGLNLLGQAEVWLDRQVRLDSRMVIMALESQAETVAAGFLALPLSVVSSVTELVLVLTMAAYWLAAAPVLRLFFLSHFAPHRRERAGQILEEMGEAMGGFVRGTVIDGGFVALLVYLGLRLIDVEYALVLALLAGLGELIPVVGPILASVPAVAVALTDSLTQGLLVLAFCVVLQQVESNLLLPYIMRSQSEIPPLFTLFALLAGWSGAAAVEARERAFWREATGQDAHARR